MVVRLTLSYRGTAYAGWQRQDNALAVQQLIEEGLEALFGEPVPIHGASRTDAGVHARGQSAHLLLPREFPLRGLVRALNHRLPQDVRALEAEAMRDDFHARKSASWKEYRYRCERAEILSPLDAPYAIAIDPDIDLEAMRRATLALPGEHDFSAFALAGGSHDSPVREILEAEWLDEGQRLDFRIRGVGFLRGMVRSLVGTLLEVGEGRREVSDFECLLEGGERGQAGPTAPARGLTLEQVRYPDMLRLKGV